MPDELYAQANWLAWETDRNLADMLIETLELSLSPLGSLDALVPVHQLSDEEVLALAESQEAVIFL